MIRYGSSYRVLTLEQAFSRADSTAARLGISRVTDITRLDRAGIPVFSSVRPGACAGSLCVNAGKGLTAAEARVGAAMEAIEFAFAEPGRSDVRVKLASPTHVLDGRRRTDAILDFCPLAGIGISADARLPCVEAEDLDGGSALVPAELVFYPFPRPKNQTYFGATTNGLASGSSVLEATVHGLFEVIERDTMSFERFRCASFPIDVGSFPTRLRSVAMSLRERGFDLAVRWVQNEFDVACVRALLWERGVLDPIYVSEGVGCHLDPAVAVTRALTEAAQSRLSYIHGARDDLTDVYAKIRRWSAARKQSYAAGIIEMMRQGGAAFDFADAPNPVAGCRSLDDVLRVIRDGLRRGGVNRALRVCLTNAAEAVQVVRVLVPLLEFFMDGLPRVGRRLLHCVESV